MSQLGKRVLTQSQVGKSLWARRLLRGCLHREVGTKPTRVWMHST